MDRTTAPGNVDNLYVDEDPGSEIQGTVLQAADRNAIQEELINAILHAGLTPSSGDLTQLEQSIRVLADEQIDGYFPIGSMMAYDGSSWVDDSTMAGWYACISANAPEGCPNLVDRFLMGKVVAGSGATGGVNSFALSTAQLPSHTHSITHNHGSHVHSITHDHGTHSHTINHGHTASAGNQSASHTHPVSGNTGNDTHNHYAGVRSPSANNIYGSGGAVSNAGRVGFEGSYNLQPVTSEDTHNHSISLTSGTQSANHTHTITVTSHTGNSGSASISHSGNSGSATISHSGNSGSAGSGSTIDNRPAFYSVLWIRKCA